MSSRFVSLAVFVALWGTACSGMRSDVAPGVLVAQLSGDSPVGFAELRAAVAKHAAGYVVEWHPQRSQLPAADDLRLAFVVRGTTSVEVAGDATNRFDVGVGDIVILRPLESLRLAAPADLLVFSLPAGVGPLGIDVPPVLRPDHDPAIDDQRGGCATEDKPYRRLLLTWRKENGPYVFHGLNAHRVKIENSFTHYHPVEGGFDEFYLVQSERAGAELITSDQRESIEAESVSAEEDPATWFSHHPLREHDLIFIPRGVIHRGLGGAVVMVITIPGFQPGAEIGVDHHLRAIATQSDPPRDVPYNVEASSGPVRR